MFIVKKRFPRFELREKEFTKQHDAENFIQQKLQEDIQFKIPTTITYLLCEDEDIVKEFSQKDIVPTSSSTDASSESSSQQQGSRQVFSPSPLSTTLRPGGMPQNWKTEKEDKDK